MEPALAKILLAVSGSRSGSARLIGNDDLDAQAKRTLSSFLSDKGGISQAEIARIIGVSRQMVNRYLKEVQDG